MTNNYKVYSNGTDVISHFCQGSLWKKIRRKYYNKTVFPIMIYYDNISVGNPLGPNKKKNKVGAVYFTMPTFPINYMQNMDAVFTTMLFMSDDREIFKNQKTFRPLLEDLKKLEKKAYGSL